VASFGEAVNHENGGTLSAAATKNLVAGNVDFGGLE
jgi:hypothetical protein